jgi:Methyltransferase domain
MTFDELFDSLPSKGWLTKPEAELLYRTAKATKGGILEVGSYYGRSACLLASLGRSVLCIDPWKDFDSDDKLGVKTLTSFRKVIAERGLVNVAWVRIKVEELTIEPMGFVYLDGDHTYEGTVHQILKAQECQPQAIAIHDVNDDGEGKEIKRAALELLGPWTERVERLAVWTL